MDPNAVLATLMLVAATAVASEPSRSGTAGAPAAPTLASSAKDIPNPAIDMPRFLAVSREAAAHRESHRLSEADFLRMRAEPGTIVLDARSAEKFARLHVRDAINLSFPDIAVDSLAATIPDKGTRILIYCNNNFLGAPEPFPAKIASASLNLSTFVSLYDYGYRNVYELGPQLPVAESRLPFEGTDAAAIVAKGGRG
ncbi:MAG: rhodanese-like domain-containing protein [Arenimonas sp.]